MLLGVERMNGCNWTDLGGGFAQDFFYYSVLYWSIIYYFLLLFLGFIGQ